MPKRKVDEEIMAQIERLKRRGEKDSEIARKLGLDPRTVRSALSRIGKIMDYDHWTAVSRQVDSALLQGHYRDLMMLTMSVQEQLKRDLTSLAISLPGFRKEKSIEAVLNALFNEKIPDNAKTQGEGVIHGHLLSKATWDRQQVLGNRLLKGMWAHEPELQSALDKWYLAFNKFQELKGILWREAELALKNELLEEPVILQTVPIMIQELYELAIHGVGEGTFDPPSDTEGTQTNAYRRVGRSQHNVRLGSREEAQFYRQSYTKMLASLSNSTRLKRSTQVADRLPQLKERVDAIVDTMLLRGRPNGRCDLCPYAVLSDSDS